MGVLVGLVFGLGAFLVGLALMSPRRPRTERSRPTWRTRTDELLAQAGIEGVSVRQFVSISAGLFLVVFVALLGTSGVPVVAAAFASFAAVTPLNLVRGQIGRASCRERV